jgi:hypothetical protein
LNTEQLAKSAKNISSGDPKQKADDLLDKLKDKVSLYAKNVNTKREENVFPFLN